MSKRIIVVGYSYPSDPAWESVFAHAADVFAVILNPASGVGSTLDPVYKALATRLRSVGIATLGYVSTRYGQRPLSEVKAEIERWFAWYDVSGIFADEQQSSADGLPYYRRIKGAVANGILVTNPGTVPDKAYLDLDAILCIVETDQQAYLAKTFPDWVKTAQSHRFYHIIYGVSDVEKVVAKVNANNAEFFYVASVKGPDPQFSVGTSLWPNLGFSSVPPAPEPAEQPATARMLSTCTDQQLLEEVGRRLAR